MFKQALEYLVGLGQANTLEVGKEVFSDKPLNKIKIPTIEPIEVRSLSGIVEYLKSGFDNLPLETLMVHVESPTSVIVFNQANCNANRDFYMRATAMLPKINFDSWYNTEEFNIKLQSCFVDSMDKEIMLKIVGNIKEEMVQTIGDDGVSQAVTAKTGIATVANVKVPNPVSLRPYRTFIEVQQPESDFIFRMQNGPRCALFESDGGAWKIKAMKAVQAYLEEDLAEEIEVGRIIVIA